MPLLPANLKPPVPVTNAAQYGYALDTETSPSSLAAAQAHLGHLAASGDPRGWDDAGELTPLQRYARMFSGGGLQGLDGTAWYHPQRLTIDAGAVAAGNANPAQEVLDVRATHGDDLPRSLRSTPSAPRWAASACSTPRAPSPSSRASRAQPHAGRPPRDLLAQRPELGRAEERVREDAGAVPAEDRAPLADRGQPGAHRRAHRVEVGLQAVVARHRHDAAVGSLGGHAEWVALALHHQHG